MCDAIVGAVRALLWFRQVQQLHSHAVLAPWKSLWGGAPQAQYDDVEVEVVDQSEKLSLIFYQRHVMNASV